jgi:hypothetical protein
VASENTTQVGEDNPVLRIELDGENLFRAYGLQLQSSSSTIRGLVINRFIGSDSGSSGAVLILVPGGVPSVPRCGRPPRASG